MELNAVFEELENALNEVNEQFETIKKNEVRVPQIEIDIIMASMRRLYEGINNINRQQNFNQVEDKSALKTAEKPEQETDSKPVDFNKEDETPNSADETQIENEVEVEKEVLLESTEAIAEEEIMSDKPVKNPELNLNPEEIEESGLFADEIFEESVTKDFQQEIDELEVKAQVELSKQDEPKHKQAKAEPKEENSNSLLLQFEDEVFSVNDSVAQKGEDNSVVNKLNSTRIENLKSAIGINDKFYFINELFNGNSQVYEDVIYTLNNFKRFEDAMQYVSTLKYKYEWDIEAEAYQKLLRFLERKFIEIHA
jgi:methionine-rich copper-binding protein CopC